MGKAQVSVVVCNTYEKETVRAAVRAGVDALGGIGRFIKPEEKILVKPNFLYPAVQEKAITTHPAVIGAVLSLLREAGALHVKVGDSPAAGSCRTALGKLALSDEDLCGAEIADMDKEVLTPVPNGSVAKELYFTEEVVEADAIIGLCKMKTHALERVTGAVKNMFGLVCGMRKAACHVKYPSASEFAKLLADIHNATPQRLHIMDAITAMEGNGPASGSPVAMNMLLASSDPVALDTVFCRLVDLEPASVPTNVMGSVAGLGTMQEDEIEILLIEQGVCTPTDIPTLVKKYGKPDFDVVRKEKQKTLLAFFSRLMGGGRKPRIDPEKCVKCGLCVSHCPVEGKGIDFKNGKNEPPVYDYKKCIRCYCCQELCPQHAIHVK